MWREIDRTTEKKNQRALLIVAVIWGLTYMLPTGTPVTLPLPSVSAETVPIWSWGVVMASAGIMVLVAEWMLNRTTRQKGWYWVAWLGHCTLTVIYTTLAVAALVDGLDPWPGWLGMCGAIARPALWGLIAHMHASYALRTEVVFDHHE